MSAHPPRPRESSARQDKIPKLSCEGCTERKVRCDKRNPCSTCQATGVVCVPTQRKRLPRGRHVKENKENKELRERLARLESLIAPDPSPPLSSSNPPATSAPSSVPFGPGPGAISHPSPVPSGVTSLAAAASSYPSILSSHPPSTSTSASSAFSASLTRTEATKRPASPPPRYLANAFWHDLVDNVCTLLPFYQYLALDPFVPQFIFCYACFV